MKTSLQKRSDLSICHGKTCVHTKGDNAKALTAILGVCLVAVTVAYIAK